MTAFISYSHTDRDLARRVSKTLSRFGLDHWWDDRIEMSAPWNDEIVSKLGEASAVLVLWTESSVKSTWVKREASFALARKKLVQVRFKSAPMPPKFAALQAAELPVWEENTLPSGIRSALNRVAALAGKPPVVDEHTRVLGLRISFDKVDSFINTKKHHEGYFPKLDGPLFKDIWEMDQSKSIKLYDELRPGSRSELTEERYYELIEYLSYDLDMKPAKRKRGK